MSEVYDKKIQKLRDEIYSMMNIGSVADDIEEEDFDNNDNYGLSDSELANASLGYYLLESIEGGSYI